MQRGHRAGQRKPGPEQQRAGKIADDGLAKRQHHISEDKCPDADRHGAASAQAADEQGGQHAQQPRRQRQHGKTGARLRIVQVQGRDHVRQHHPERGEGRAHDDQVKQPHGGQHPQHAAVQLARHTTGQTDWIFRPARATKASPALCASASRRSSSMVVQR